MKTLYEASNALEAHMLVDLLKQQGLSAHLAGEYLQGGVGMLPASGFVRLLVDDEQYDAARDFIAQWEAQQPADDPPTSALLDRFYAALKALSAEELADCVSEDFELDWQGSDAIPWAGRWRGVEGLIGFVKQLNLHLEILEVQRLKQFADAELTLVLLRGHWRLRATQQDVRAMACNVFAIEGGRIRRYTVLNNSAAFAQALAANY